VIIPFRVLDSSNEFNLGACNLAVRQAQASITGTDNIYLAVNPRCGFRAAIELSDLTQHYMVNMLKGAGNLEEEFVQNSLGLAILADPTTRATNLMTINVKIEESEVDIFVESIIKYGARVIQSDTYNGDSCLTAITTPFNYHGFECTGRKEAYSPQVISVDTDAMIRVG